jgi:hypothetical protein
MKKSETKKSRATVPLRRFCAVAHSAKANSALWPIAQNELKVEYLGEIEVIFEMALGNESGNQVGSILEKNQRSKIS